MAAGAVAHLALAAAAAHGEETESDHDEFDSGGPPPPPAPHVAPRPRRRDRAPAAPVDPEGEEDEFDGGLDFDAHAPVLPPGPPAQPPADAPDELMDALVAAFSSPGGSDPDISDPGGSASSCDSEFEGAPEAGPPTREELQALGVKVPHDVYGVGIAIERHRSNGSVGLRVTCPRHPECRCYRAIKVGYNTLGPGCASAFLADWVSQAGHMSREENKKYRPTIRQVQQFVEDAGFSVD